MARAYIFISALLLATRCMAGPDDTVLMQTRANVLVPGEPGYGETEEVLKAAELRAKGFDVEDLEYTDAVKAPVNSSEDAIRAFKLHSQSEEDIMIQKVASSAWSVRAAKAKFEDCLADLQVSEVGGDANAVARAAGRLASRVGRKIASDLGRRRRGTGPPMSQAQKRVAEARKARRRARRAAGSRRKCFPGDAVVHVEGRGAQRLAGLSIGDRVQVMQPSGLFAHELVTGFLHKITPGAPSSLLTVTHSKGEFRASPAHMVFVMAQNRLSDKTAANLQVGDEIVVAGMRPSRVLAIRRSFTDAGMYAPLTSSGMLVVDGVVASIYASSASGLWLPHIAAHAFLFPVRLYNMLGLSVAQKSDANDEMHPFLNLIERQLGLNRFQKFAASWA